jgi:hypothetical protein
MIGALWLASLLLLWDLPRDYAPQPDGFAVEVVSRFGTDTFSVPPSALGACEPEHPEAHCGVWPRGCPVGESLTARVRGQWGEEEGPWSEQVVCELSTVQACLCFVSTPEERERFAKEPPVVRGPAPPAPPSRLPVPPPPMSTVPPTVFALPAPMA